MGVAGVDFVWEPPREARYGVVMFPKMGVDYTFHDRRGDLESFMGRFVNSSWPLTSLASPHSKKKFVFLLSFFIWIKLPVVALQNRKLGKKLIYFLAFTYTYNTSSSWTAYYVDFHRQRHWAVFFTRLSGAFGLVEGLTARALLRALLWIMFLHFKRRCYSALLRITLLRSTHMHMQLE